MNPDPLGFSTSPRRDGPALWTGGKAQSRPLATDRVGGRVAITDGARVALWDARDRAITQLLPESGLSVHSARFAPAGDLLVIQEEDGAGRSGLMQLRVVGLEGGEELATIPFRCGCLVNFDFDEAARSLRVVVSSPELGGTWVLSWALGQARRETGAGGAAPFEFQGRHKLMRYVVRAGDGLEWVKGRHVLWVGARGEADEEVWWFDALGHEAPRTWRLPSRGEALGCEKALRQCRRVLLVTDDALWVALGLRGGDAWVSAHPLGEGAPMMEAPLGAHLPLMWLRGGARPPFLLTEAESDAEDRRGRDTLSDPDRAPEWTWRAWQIEAARSAPAGASGPQRFSLRGPVGRASLPLSLVSLPGQWESQRVARPFRELYGLLSHKPLPGWNSGQSQVMALQGAQGVVVANRRQAWRVVSGRPPRRLAPMQLFPMRALLDGVSPSLSGRRTMVVARSDGIAWVSPEEPGGQGRSVAATRAQWEPQGGEVQVAARLPGGGLLAMLKVGYDEARLVRFDAQGRQTAARSQPMPRRRYGRSWSMWLSQDGHQGALVALDAPKGERAPRRLVIQRFEPATLRGQRRDVVSLPQEARALSMTPGVGLVLMTTARTLTGVWLEDAGADQGPPSFEWSPPVGWSLKGRDGALVLGSGLIALRLYRGERTSQERWVTLSVSPGSAPRVVDQRRFTYVASAAASGRVLYVMDGRGVLSEVSIDEQGWMTLVRRIYLHPRRGAWFALDAEGRATVPSAATPERARALSWWRSQRLAPALLDGRGRQRASVRLR